jgi:hypothetical protein
MVSRHYTVTRRIKKISGRNSWPPVLDVNVEPHPKTYCSRLDDNVNPLNAELNPICHLLALLGAHHIFHVSGLSVKQHCNLCIVK